ncbi:WecB/TagA/CpsF family glycosyltransferase [Nesterenkonia sandarakina]|uniref:N-acetylglucosaminyldiphosphoundecaprenol N-acetyl-beta-D-mannosaminyltransferase n=1 Tax=Nesterenkonia sandarakina TaxID=272918 RepID=A0A7Z0EBG3_9MICC|nr:WecB/TagA/CpsF family glycosyltransferase [Nesterenkonia sandarakina]NYJ17822.1 N-acetylglucosaminyldiphosphoundecaprenol N-acetyl-beta-D-mannosaminyltransferase [Nesterenkonia sandarakina]
MTVIPSLNVPLLGVAVTPLNRAELLAHIRDAVQEGRRMLVAGHNLHSVYLWYSLPEFRDFYDRAGAVVVDGMPLLALLRIGQRAPLRTEHRIGSTDWLDGLADLEGIQRVTLLGGTPAASTAVLRHLRSLGGDVAWQGIPGDPWRAEDVDEVAEEIRAHDPQVLLIGMGMPLQERIADQLAARLDVPVIATVGGALDQLGGTQSLAPRRLGTMGLEWAWRLATDPRRLAGRYLLEPMKLAALLMWRA